LPWLHPKLDEAHTELETNVIPCGTKFLLVLIFAIFASFFAVCKKKFPQNKTTATFFSAKNYSTVEITYKNTGLKEKML